MITNSYTTSFSPLTDIFRTIINQNIFCSLVLSKWRFFSNNKNFFWRRR
uniref:Uncharacterized protein n=1 Tax=uncultured gamma proteobacterium EB080_L93H08 TaxID=710973 RepID=E0Y2Q8_9GAMM|nr:hypothetical protein [uncultured gamma proteobacterium EB080_L93H08]